MARLHDAPQRYTLQQQALTLSDEALHIYLDHDATEDAGEVYLTQAALFWQRHLDNPHSNNGQQALQCAQHAHEFLTHSQRVQLVCASHITLAELLFATSNPVDGLTNALPYLWQGYTLATQIHDAPHIQQATSVLRQMQTQSPAPVFAQVWHQVLGIALPDWGKW